VLEYVVQRMRAAACDEIRVVTRPEKQDVIEAAERLGARVIEGRPVSVAESVLLAMDDLAPDDVVLLGFPDSVWEPADGFSQLFTRLDAETDAVLGVFASREPRRSDVVTLDAEDRVATVDVKPEQPSSSLIWGCAAAGRQVMGGLSDHSEPGVLFDVLARGGRVGAVRFPGEFIDVGTEESLRRARGLLGARR
jgi:glucose-1-phosphate thymidylyltransferase